MSVNLVSTTSDHYHAPLPPPNAEMLRGLVNAGALRRADPPGARRPRLPHGLGPADYRRTAAVCAAELPAGPQ